ncbi:MAG: lamin tail domain-containing protein, partial [Rubripirellula sp.]
MKLPPFLSGQRRSIAKAKKPTKAKKRRRLSLQTLESRRVLAGNPIISEFVASNGSSFVDGFGDDADWIEIRNDADVVVELDGYYLTDDAADLTKWQFTAPTSLNPGEHLVVFASSLDVVDPSGFQHTNFKLSAGGEYLALVAPDQTLLSEFGDGGADYPPQFTDVSYGVSGTVLVNRDSVAEFMVPSDDGLGLTWTANSFDGPANGFSLGRAAIGYENSPGDSVNYSSLISESLDVGTTNVYVRTEFEIPSAADISDLQLKLFYDDGFVAYLNGTRVLGENDPTPLGYNTPATSGHSDTAAVAGVDFDLSSFASLLVDGTNTLAIHAMNSSSGSSDFLIIPELTTNSLTSDAGYLFSPTPGAANTRLQTLGPGISNVTPSLTIADANSPLTITATIDPFIDPVDVTTPQLHYRAMFAGEVTLAMVDDGTAGDAVSGDGIFTATIPASALSAG